MTFQPQMQSRIEGITVLDELKWRTWDGVIADVWHVACSDEARGEYVAPYPRLVVVLEHDGDGDVDLTTTRAPAGSGRPIARHPLCYVPAGVRVWSRLARIRRLRHLDLHLDMDALARRFGDQVDSEAVETPRLKFADDALLGLARLIAAECTAPSGLHDLYGDGLVTALLVSLLRVSRKADRRRGQLPPRQLRRAIDFIEDNCVRNIRLQELAELTGLSQSYFCSAFKASTGMPPHKWQMRARVDRVKALLHRPDVTLADAAAAAGFADQAHLTRVFRQVVGTTPAAWQRNLAV
ncbi:helix-turn-helix domain-containing protein [Azospirillum sp. ST 5-10]|uniref:helix-turn-helix domain-containing protein n=1 Tax=unclassified Azospirillum TaxID=2630922 RepID=UPI003F4A5B81